MWKTTARFPRIRLQLGPSRLPCRHCCSLQFQFRRFQSQKASLPDKSTDWILNIIEDEELNEQKAVFKVPKVTYAELLDSLYVQELGYAYLKYAYSRYLLQNHLPLLNGPRLVTQIDAFVRFLDSKLNRSSKEYVGQFTLQNLDDCGRFVDSLIETSIEPNTKAISFDQSLNNLINKLEPKTKDTIQNLQVLSKSRSLLPDTSQVDPKYFLDAKNLAPAFRILEQFGEYSFQFHLLHSSKPVSKPGNYLAATKSLVLNNSSKLLHEFRNGFSNPDIVIKSKQGLFFRYLACLDLRNSELSLWYEGLSTVSSKTFANTDSSVKDSDLFNKNPTFHPEGPLELLDFANELHSSDIDSTGSLFIHMHVWEYLWKVSPENHSKFWTYTEQFNSILEKSITHDLINSVFPHLQQETTSIKRFIGLYALHDIEGTKKLIQSFFKETPDTFEQTRRYLQKTVRTKNIHLFKYHDITREPANKMSLPSLDVGSKIVRFVLQNLEAVSYKDARNYSIIKDIRYLGSFQNNFYLNYWLFRSATPLSVAYISQIRKFYLSSYFNRLLLDEVRVFDNLFDDKRYQQNLVRARNSFEFAENQYNQYLTALIITGDANEINNYNQRSINLFMEVIKSLNSEEIAATLKTIYQNEDYTFSLDNLYVESMVDKFNETDFTAKSALKLNNTTSLESRQILGLTRHFLSFLSCEFIIRLRLYEFIPTRRVYEKLMEKLTQQQKLIDALPSSDIDTLLVQNDTKTVHDVLVQILQPTLGQLPPSGFSINRVEINEKRPRQSDLIACLPDLPGNFHYGKVACINYHVSNAYLKSINQGPPRVVEEYCSKLGTTGQEFFRFAARKHMASLNLIHTYNENQLDQLIRILDSGYLYSCIALESDILIGCVRDANYTKLIRLQINNSYQLIRLSKAAFKQYMGALCLQDLAIADNYVEHLVKLIMANMSDPEYLQSLTNQLSERVGNGVREFSQSRQK